MHEPLISVIIPAHNGAPWLKECLNSVMGQTYARTEIVVIDDGSTDATAAILAEYQPRVRVIHQTRQGIGAARNRGLEQTRGEWIAFIDQDDLWRADKLELQVCHALRHPDQVVIHSDAEEFDEKGTVHPSFLDLFPGLRYPERVFEEIIRLAVPLMSTVLMSRRYLVQQQLAFFEPASGVDDVGMFLEIADRGGKFGLIDQRLTYRRLHPNNLSKCHLHRFEKRVCLYRALADRIARPQHRRALSWGLRDACFRVAEWHWGQLELEPARQHFRQAQGFDRLGLRAAGLRLASRLPRPMVHWLQKTKRLLVG